VSESGFSDMKHPCVTLRPDSQANRAGFHWVPFCVFEPISFRRRRCSSVDSHVFGRVLALIVAVRLDIGCSTEHTVTKTTTTREVGTTPPPPAIVTAATVVTESAVTVPPNASTTSTMTQFNNGRLRRRPSRNTMPLIRRLWFLQRL
jgi:hypothetical protein